MNYETKIEEFKDKIESSKIIIETQFANIEKYIKENENINYNELVSLLSTFNTLNIKYEQLCEDLTLFLTIFMKKEDQEFRIYKTEELIELLENEVKKLEENNI